MGNARTIAEATRGDTSATDVSSERLPRRLRIASAVFGFLVVALQRLGIALDESTSIQVTTLVLLATVIWMVTVARLRVSPVAVVLFSAIAISALLAALLNSDSAVPQSMTSLILFLTTYTVVLLVGAQNRSVAVGYHFYRGFVLAVRLGATLAIIQWIAQRLGLGYLDVFAWVPTQWLVGGYNTYWDLRFQGAAGSFKPNGMLFLEPSVLSLFAGLAIVFSLAELFVRGFRGRIAPSIAWLIVLSLGFAVSASASGVLVLGLAAIPFLFSIRRRAPLALALIGVGVIAVASGLFNSVIAKALEGFTSTTSAALRLTLPYETLVPVWAERPWLGWGPGTVRSFIADSGIVGGLQASTLMKLLVEYGLPTAVLLFAAVIWCLCLTKSPLPVVVATLGAWLLPAEALLSAPIVMLVIFALPNWQSDPEEKATHPAFSNSPITKTLV